MAVKIEIDTDNSDQVLLPYMTAHITFHVADRTGILRVPNAALRWSPQEDAGEVQPLAPGEDGVLWTPDGQTVRQIQVKVGVSDGLNSEVSGDGIQEGTPVVVGEIQGGAGDKMSNPFVPQFGKKPG